MQHHPVLLFAQDMSFSQNHETQVLQGTLLQVTLQAHRCCLASVRSPTNVLLFAQLSSFPKLPMKPKTCRAHCQGMPNAHRCHASACSSATVLLFAQGLSSFQNIMKPRAHRQGMLKHTAAVLLFFFLHGCPVCQTP